VDGTNLDQTVDAEMEEIVSQDEDSCSDDRTSVTMLRNCFTIILDTLAASNPRYHRDSFLYVELVFSSLGFSYIYIVRKHCCTLTSNYFMKFPEIPLIRLFSVMRCRLYVFGHKGRDKCHEFISPADIIIYKKIYNIAFSL